MAAAAAASATGRTSARRTRPRLGARAGAAAAAAWTPAGASSMRKLRPASLNHSPVLEEVRQNSTATTPGSRTSCRAPNAGNGDCRAFCLYTVVPGGLSSGGRSCHSAPVLGRMTPQCRTRPIGFVGSHSRPIVCTPCAFVLTVASKLAPSVMGMEMRSVTSPMIAARTGVAGRERRGRAPTPPPGAPTPRAGARTRLARRRAGSATRRDLWGSARGSGSGRRVSERRASEVGGRRARARDGANDHKPVDKRTESKNEGIGETHHAVAPGVAARAPIPRGMVESSAMGNPLDGRRGSKRDGRRRGRRRARR